MDTHSTTPEAPFHLPLGPEQFCSGLKKGQGRALMHLMRHGAEGLGEFLIDACLTEQRYDPQCEGERTDWLIRLLGAAGLDIIDELVGAMSDPTPVEDEEDCRDLGQQCRVALHFARRGSVEAQIALYSALQVNGGSRELIGAGEIIALDGADGLIHVAEHIGTWLQKDPALPAGNLPLVEYDQRHGEGSAERVLWSAARVNTSVAVYVSRLASAGESDEREVTRFLDVQGMTVKEIIHLIESDDPEVKKVALLGWGRTAQDHELAAIATRMFRESSPGRLARYLSVFQNRAMPRFDRRLVGFADHDDSDVRWYSIWALANHRHSAVRELALARADQGQNRERELKLFRKNYQAGDWLRIESALVLPEDADRVHSLITDLIDVFQENGGPEARRPLLLVYEHSPCAICRESAVDLLLGGGLAPAWLLAECRYDCDEDIRKAVTPAAGL